jgi:hypothetical protein
VYAFSRSIKSFRNKKQAVNLNGPGFDKALLEPSRRDKTTSSLILNLLAFKGN